jgi:S1-C subfamily serine protease
VNRDTEPKDMNSIIREKILWVLDIFPKVSPSMLQISLGSGIPADTWRPILEQLIREGEVHRAQRTVQGPSDRSQVITTLSRDADPNIAVA